MEEVDPRALLAEIERRAAALEYAKRVTKELHAELFDRQLYFINHPSRRKAALCTRRAGKTEMWPRYSVETALKSPRGLIRIWGSSRLRAKELQWQAIKDVCARRRINVRTHDTELTVTFDNGAIIRLVGADKDHEVEKKRGDKTVLEIVLEAQNIGSRLKKMVEDVIEPCLLDMRGTLCLEGTPHPVLSGYWFQVTGENAGSHWVSKGDADGTGAGWDVFHWSVLDNPFMKKVWGDLAEMKVRKRWADDNPTYMREWKGLWVRDDQAMYYRFDALRNTYDPSKLQPWGPGWNHVLGWDLGSTDAMALVVWGWHASHECVYEVFSWKKPGASTEEVMQEIDRLEKLGLNFIAKVADTGGGGKMYVEEVMRRYTHSFEPAKKAQKYEHVMLLNDDLLGGFIKCIPGSPLALEYAELQKDPDSDPDKPPQEHPNQENHCCFVAGTKVLTDHGQVNIEELRPGMMALTRVGWRKIVKTAPTGIKPVVTVGPLTGTGDHPIWTENRGWVPLAKISASDVVLYACENSENLKSSNGIGMSTVDTRQRHSVLTGFISNGPRNTGGHDGCIETSGKQHTDAFPRNTTSTTRTTTRVTTASRILNAFLAQFTSDCTGSSGLQNTLKNLLRTLQKLWPQRRSGIAQQKVEHGTRNMHLKRPPLALHSLESRIAAWFAGPASNHSKLQLSAAQSALLDSDETAALMTSTANAQPAERSSASINTQDKRTALVFAVTVEGQHEFFANGVLVSNCDAALYGHRHAYHYTHEAQKAKVEPGSKAYYEEVEEKMWADSLTSATRVESIVEDTFVGDLDS